jgi:SAM-dependent methyltransferase
VRNKRVLDIGCGSGIHSRAFWELGATEVFSFDVDPNSVAATHSQWEQQGAPKNWSAHGGSILDPQFIAAFRDTPFDIVYAWGVLHHTGALWTAMEHAYSLVKKGGKIWLALYVKGPRYPRDLQLKKKFNRASWMGKRYLYWKFKTRTIVKCILFRDWAALKNSLWNRHLVLPRGMNAKNDILDWLGGLPYEVASAEEVVDFSHHRHFQLEKINTANEGGNNVFLFSRSE